MSKAKHPEVIKTIDNDWLVVSDAGRRKTRASLEYLQLRILEQPEMSSLA